MDGIQKASAGILSAILPNLFSTPKTPATMSLNASLRTGNAVERIGADSASFSQQALRQAKRMNLMEQSIIQAHFHAKAQNNPLNIDPEILAEAREHMETLQQVELKRLARNLDIDEGMLAVLTPEDLMEYYDHFLYEPDPDSDRQRLFTSIQGGVRAFSTTTEQRFATPQEFWDYKFLTDEEGNFIRNASENYMRNSLSLSSYAVENLLEGELRLGSQEHKTMDQVNPAILHRMNNALESGDSQQIGNAFGMALKAAPWEFFDPSGYHDVREAMIAKMSQIGFFGGNEHKWKVFSDEHFLADNIELLYDEMRYFELYEREYQPI